MTEPKGPWQQPSLGLEPCPHHRGHCAYRIGDPDCCDFCHASWQVITGKWGEDRTAHLQAHTAAQEKAATKALTRTPRKQGQEGGQTLNGYRLG